MTDRRVDQIDADLRAYAARRRDTLDRVVTSMMMLNAIDHRVEVLLEQRSAAVAGV